MRIIKSTDDAITRIVSEMVNIEAGKIIVKDGKPIGDKGARPKYPEIVDGNIVYNIKSQVGYIFVSPSLDVDSFEDKLVEKLAEVEKVLGYDHLKEYHTAFSSYHTNVKIRSDLTINTNRHAPKTVNVRRYIGNHKHSNTSPSNLKPRFRWFIEDIFSINHTIDSNNCDRMIDMHTTSIFYDSDDISNLADEHVLFDFSKKHLRSYENVVDTKKFYFSDYVNPVATMIIPKYKEKFSGILRNIPTSKVFEADMKMIELAPVEIDEGKTSTDVCSVCKTQLYDDIYILYGQIDNPMCKQGTAVCPICLHSSPKDTPLERKYYIVYRTTYSDRTVYDMVDASKYSDDIKDVMKESLKSFDKSDSYFVIGDKYIGVPNIDKFLFGPDYKKDIFKGRKIVHASSAF